MDCYVAFTKKEDIIKKSSSGGIFFELASKVIYDNGFVVGASFVNFPRLEHVIINDRKQLLNIMGSKYLKSDTKFVFPKIKNLLESGEKILFSGTPCQIGALKSFLRKDYINLICCEVICHGVPLAKVFEKYLDEEFFEKKDIKINFRYKKQNWKNYHIKIESKNKVIDNIFYNNPYCNLFLSDYTLMSACYDCKFKHSNTKADLTIGDFWGIEKINPKYDNKYGISAVIINSQKGESLFNDIKNNLIYYKVEYEDVAKYNPALIKSAIKPNFYDKFWEEYDTLSIKKLNKKYGKKTNKIKKIIRKIFMYLNILFLNGKY